MTFILRGLLSALVVLFGSDALARGQPVYDRGALAGDPAQDAKRDLSRHDQLKAPELTVRNNQALAVYRHLEILAKHDPLHRLNLSNQQINDLVAVRLMRDLRFKDWLSEIDQREHRADDLPDDLALEERKQISEERIRYVRMVTEYELVEALALLTPLQRELLKCHLVSYLFYGPPLGLGMGPPVGGDPMRNLPDTVRAAFGGSWQTPLGQIPEMDKSVDVIFEQRRSWRCELLEYAEEVLDQVLARLTREARERLITRFVLDEFEPRIVGQLRAENPPTASGEEEYRLHVAYVSKVYPIPFLPDGSFHWGPALHECCREQPNFLELTSSQRTALLLLLRAESERLEADFAQLREDFKLPKNIGTPQIQDPQLRQDVEDRLVDLWRWSSRHCLHQAQNILSRDQYQALRPFAGEALLWAHPSQLRIVLDRDELGITEEEQETLIEFLVEKKHESIRKQEAFAEKSWKVLLDSMPPFVRHRFLEETGFARFDD